MNEQAIPSYGAPVGRGKGGRFVKLAREERGQAGVQLRCPLCIAGQTTIGWRDGVLQHRIPGGYQVCPDWDAEARHVSEPMGWHTFAWWPVRCRNGKLRWLTSVERFSHADGTFSYALGNRAH